MALNFSVPATEHQSITSESESISNSNNTYNNTSTVKSSTFELSFIFRVLVFIFYNIILVLAVFGNLLVLYVIYSLPRMRTVTNYLLANLALGDLLIALFCVPFTYISVLYTYWPFGEFLCHLVSPANAIGVLVSAFTLVALAMERYMAILHPLRPRLRKSQVGIVISIIWTAAFLTSLPIAIVTRQEFENGKPLCDEYAWNIFNYSDNVKLVYNITLNTLQFIFPLVVLIITYTRIAMVVCGKDRLMIGEDSRNRTPGKGKRKAIILTLAVVLGYMIAWLPFNLNYIANHHIPGFKDLSYSTYIFFVCHWMAMSHTMYNPFIYAWINNSFRQAFKQVFMRSGWNCKFCYVPATEAPRPSSGSKWNSSYRGGNSGSVRLYHRRRSSAISFRTASTRLTRLKRMSSDSNSYE